MADDSDCDEKDYFDEPVLDMWDPVVCSRFDIGNLKMELEAVQSSSVRVARARIVIVGQDNVGKTCLADTLCGIPFQENESTAGIKLKLIIRKAASWREVIEGSSRENYLTSLMKSPLVLEDAISSSKTMSDTEKEFGISEMLENSELFGEAWSAASLVKHELSSQCELLLKGLENDVLLVIHLWDHGGQEAYLPAHVALLGDYSEFSSGIYIIAFDQSKLLTDLASPSVFRCKDGDDTVQPLCLMEKNVDYLSYWMTAIQIAHPCAEKSLDGSADGKSRWMGEKEGIVSPPTFLVGTNDKAANSSELRGKNEAALSELVKKMTYQEHLVQQDKSEKMYWPVENSDSGKPDCAPGKEIMEKIEQLAFNHWEGRPYPIRWLMLEKCLVAISKERIVKRSFTAGIAFQLCFVKGAEVEVALKYLSSLGVILYYPEVEGLKEKIFVDPQWLIDVVCSFVTAKKPCSRLLSYWDEAKDTGKVTADLAMHFLACDGVRKEDQPAVLCILEHLDILYNPDPSIALEQSQYVLVPGLLQTFSDGFPSFLSLDPERKSPPPLIFAPVDVNAFPEPLFFRLVVRCLRSKMYNHFPATLKRDLCVFKNSDIDFEICLYRKRYMVLSISSVDFEENPEKQTIFSDLREFVCGQVDIAKRNGMGGFKYEVCVQPGIREMSSDCRIAEDSLVLLGQFSGVYSTESKRCRKLRRQEKQKAVLEGVCLWLQHEKDASQTSASLQTKDQALQGDNLKVTDDQLTDLHTKIYHKWHVVGRKLGLSNYHIDGIEFSLIMKPDTEKCIKMLLTWSHQQSGGHGAVFNLLKTLFDVDVDLGDAAKEVFEKSVIDTFLRLRERNQ